MNPDSAVGEETRRPVVGMALYGDATFDSRVRREATALGNAGYKVVLVCLGDSSPPTDLPPSVRVEIRIPTASSALPGVANPFLGGADGRLARLFRPASWLLSYGRNLRSWGHLALEAAGPVDIWHLHDLPALAALAPRLRGRVPYVYDSHEIFLEAGTARRLRGPARTYLRALERRLVGGAAALVTVNDSLAQLLGHRYRPRRTLVVHNCPGRWTAPADAPDLLRRAAGIPLDAAVVLYHGSLGGGRGIEQLLAALVARGMENVHLVLLGPGDGRATYRAMTADPRWAGRAHILDAISPAELLPWVATADVGGVLIQRTSLNHLLSTPNKLFECLAAGVPVLASDFPTMRRIVLDPALGPLGQVCDPADPAAIAGALRSILSLEPAAKAELRARCLAAAHDRWSWEVESAGLVELYNDLLGAAPREVAAP